MKGAIESFMLMVAALLCVSCSAVPDKCPASGMQPDIFPDYSGVTIPPNIAPMNFSMKKPGRYLLRISGSSVSMTVRSGRTGLFDIPSWKWRRMTAAACGEDLEFTVFGKGETGWTSFTPFTMSVSAEPADPYIAYRLIPPGYVAWRRMGIFQRCISDFRQTEILSNSRTGGNCINCHSFCMQDPARMLFHSRAANAGTIVVSGGVAKKLNTKTPETISPLVYPCWHPGGRYIAFSNNDTRQSFFMNHPNRVEVYDRASDIVVYDAESHTITSSPLLKSDDSFETFPAFSPEGDWLYFCSAPAIDSVQDHYSDVRYSLCRIAFNAADGRFGTAVDTLVNADTSGMSVSFPRVSPDGRFLVFTRHAFGNFSIWHHDADLCCMDLSSGNVRELDAANSPDTESYHSWSSDSRWIVFSSRRLDGLYTRPFFTYINDSGEASKPFLLPQRDPVRYYERLDFSCNIPEFVSGRVTFTGRRLARTVKGPAAADVTFFVHDHL